jgi:hypothetical protein
MNRFRIAATVAVTAAAGVMLTACAGSTMFSSLAPQPASAPSSIRSEQIVGRWGYGAYYNEKDRAKTQTAAKAECARPVTISQGPNGGLMMPMVNQSQQELSLKGGPGGKDFIGPPGEAGAEHDSEIVSFDGKVLVTRTVATDAAGRATSIYVRCGSKGMMPAQGSPSQRSPAHGVSPEAMPAQGY